jgi:hypothetical protein
MHEKGFFQIQSKLVAGFSSHEFRLNHWVNNEAISPHIVTAPLEITSESAGCM